MWNIGRAVQKLSSEVNLILLLVDSEYRRNASWLIIAPLGIAVVPEVYMITLVLLTRTLSCLAFRSASVIFPDKEIKVSKSSIDGWGLVPKAIK